MLGGSDAVLDHAVQLVLGGQQTVVVHRAAGALPGTVLDVVGFIQHQDLA